MKLRSFLGLAGMVLLLFGNSTMVFAHARLVKSTPAAGAEVAPDLKQIELVFNELLDEGFNSVEVYEASELNSKSRKNYVTGKPRVDAKDRTRLTAEIQPLSPGKYFLEYRVLSRDGHSAPGRIAFMVSSSST